MDDISHEEYILWMTYVMKDTFYGWHMSWRIHFMDDICHGGYILWMTYVWRIHFMNDTSNGWYIMYEW